MISLNELTLDQVTQSSSTSNLTKQFLDHRLTQGFNEIKLITALWKSKKDFIELTFKANATLNSRKRYNLTIRFYGVHSIMTSKGSYEQLSHKNQEAILKQVFHTTEMKVHSDDPSFTYQGFWEDLAGEDMAIFRFKKPAGQDIWHDRHKDSGGLSNPRVRLPKHLSQLISDIDKYVRTTVQILKVQ